MFRGWRWLGTAGGLGWLLASGCGGGGGGGSALDDVRAQVGRAQSCTFQTGTNVPANPPPQVDVTVTDPATARDIANAILDLPVMAPGNYSCPIDYGIGYFLAFTDASGQDVMRAFLFPNGCQWAEVTNGGPFPAAELWSLGSPDFWSHLAADLGLPEADIYPYQPPLH